MDLYLSKIISFDIWWNSFLQIVFAILLFFLLLFSKKIIFNFLKKFKKKRFLKKTISKLITILEKIPNYIFFIIQLYVPLLLLNLPDKVHNWITSIVLFLISLEFIKFINKIIIFLIQEKISKKWRIDKSVKMTIQLLVKIIVWIVGILFILSNLWIEVTPLIASLWVWWIAVAFALQNILQDFFSSLSIIFSKPFKVWDYISISSMSKSWTVSSVNLKYTTLKSLQWYDIIIPNKEILNSSLENFWVMKYRRIRFDIWVTYEVDIKKLKEVNLLIKNIFKWIKYTKLERCRLTELKDYSVNFKISYVVNYPDYDKYLDINEKVLFKILEEFSNSWIDIAYPTQVIYAWTLKK